MHRNPVWLGFLTIIAVITAWFINNSVSEILDYQSLSDRATPSTTEWTVDKLGEGHFVPRAEYTYEVDGETYHGATTFLYRSFRNEYAINEDIEKMKEREWLVWYAPEDPSRSALDKWFPISSTLSGAFMLAIFLYFIWLGRYVARRTGE